MRGARTLRADAGADPAKLLWLSAEGEAGVAFEAASADAAEGGGAPKLRRIRGVAYSGGVMFPASTYGMPTVVDMAGVVVGSQSRPLLLDHDAKAIVGHTDAIEASGKIKVSGVVSGTGEAAREVTSSAANGFPWKLSVGGMVRGPYVRVDEGASIQVNGRTFKGPLLVARRFELQEISFVSVAGDDRTSVSIAASAGHFPKREVISMDFEQWLQAKGFDPNTITDQQRTALKAAFDREHQAGEGAPAGAPLSAGAGQSGGAAGTPATDPVADYRQRMAAETARVGSIMQACAGDFQELQAQAIRENWTPEQATREVARERELRTLRAGRPHGPPMGGGQGNQPQHQAQVLEAALCLSAGIPENWLGARMAREHGNEPGQRIMNEAVSAGRRNTTLHVVMDNVIHAAGQYYGGSRKDPAFIREALRADRALRLQAGGGGFSTISLSGILSNVANKALLSSFEAVATVWQIFCAIRSHADFKVHTRYRLDSSGAFRPVGPDGELKHIGLAEASYTNQLGTFGAIIALTRQMMINDDLGAFLQIPTILGRMSATAVEEEVFKLLLSNPSSFFASGNGNYMDGADSALSIAAVSAAEQKFMDQVDSNNKPVLVTPAILLHGTALKTLADQLYSEEALNVTTTANKPQFSRNPHKGKYQPVCTPYMNNTAIKDRDGAAITGQSATLWYLFGNPANRAAIAVATLNGNRMPVIESDDTPFDTLGMQWRSYFDFGVGMEETVGAVMAAGV